jgi:hypothetical protein
MFKRCLTLFAGAVCVAATVFAFPVSGQDLSGAFSNFNNAMSGAMNKTGNEINQAGTPGPASGQAVVRRSAGRKRSRTHAHRRSHHASKHH